MSYIQPDNDSFSEIQLTQAPSEFVPVVQKISSKELNHNRTNAIRTQISIANNMNRRKVSTFYFQPSHESIVKEVEDIFLQYHTIINQYLPLSLRYPSTWKTRIYNMLMNHYYIKPLITNTNSSENGYSTEINLKHSQVIWILNIIYLFLTIIIILFMIIVYVSLWISNIDSICKLKEDENSNLGDQVAHDECESRSYKTFYTCKWDSNDDICQSVSEIPSLVVIVMATLLSGGVIHQVIHYILFTLLFQYIYLEYVSDDSINRSLLLKSKFKKLYCPKCNNYQNIHHIYNNINKYCLYHELIYLMNICDDYIEEEKNNEKGNGSSKDDVIIGKKRVSH